MADTVFLHIAEHDWIKGALEIALRTPVREIKELIERRDTASNTLERLKPYMALRHLDGCKAIPANNADFKKKPCSCGRDEAHDLLKEIGGE